MCSDNKAVEAKCENLPKHQISGFDQLLTLASYMIELPPVSQLLAITKSDYGIRFHYTDGTIRFVSYNLIL